MRVMLDRLGDSHSDLFIKLDGIPSLLIVGDTHYLSDFLETESETKEELVIEYIEYLKDSINEISNEELFFPTQLCDEYVGGLIVKKSKKGLLEITESYNKNLFGWSVTKSSIHSEAAKHWESFQNERVMHLSKERLLKGLDWSSKNLG